MPFFTSASLPTYEHTATGPLPPAMTPEFALISLDSAPFITTTVERLVVLALLQQQH